ncbi:MAG: L-serine ammonia-lyase, iron-sulfur-dependent, subunit alpha [Tissierellia bacterium]|nr:L-serine ammonia-lyase, iron-sulfur-dependent, subunit alpha [Tissierellia bacterium]
MEKTKNLFIDIVKEDSNPALGCTEPVAVAFASATAAQYITGNILNIKVVTSKSIYKNGKSVFIPKTNSRGLDLATALGVVAGDPKDEFMVLKNIDDSKIAHAKEMVEKGIVSVEFTDNSPSIYVYVMITTVKETVEVYLRHSHIHIDQVLVNGSVVYEDIFENGNGTAMDFIKDITLKELREVCENIPLDEIDFVRDGIEMNLKAAKEGLNTDLGLGIGSTLNRLHTNGKLNIDVFTKARLLTASACDMRMGGGECPIMTSGGSGNQGIGVIVPIAVVAEYENIEEEKLIRAIFFAHLINRYVKMFTGKLSSICGCAMAAGVGASAAITWMLGGDDEKIAGSCNNMLANLTGMICDGAKDTCAFKLSTSAEEAVLSAYLAMEGVIPEKNVGIVGESIEDTIKNLGYLCEEGLDHADSAIINIINRGE